MEMNITKGLNLQDYAISGYRSNELSIVNMLNVNFAVRHERASRPFDISCLSCDYW
jgi:hypothetical protein